MRKIISIEHVEKTPKYTRTYALLDDGTIAVGFGTDFKVEDLVMVFFHYGQIKMSKKVDKSN